MDLKNKIINDHLNFRRISQEGGYYVNSSINQTILHDLPKFYNSISNKIESLIKQLNNSGKKVSVKSQDNITDFLNKLRRKEQQLETLSLSLNSIYLDKNFTNQIITMDDILKYSDNLKSYQLKGYDIIDSLEKIINSSKISKPLSVETNSKVNMSSSMGISPSQAQAQVSPSATASLQINNSLSTPTSNVQPLTSSGPTTTSLQINNSLYTPTSNVQPLTSSGPTTTPLQTQVSSSSTTTETAQEANAQAEEAQKEAQAQALARKQEEDEKVKEARFLKAQAEEAKAQAEQAKALAREKAEAQAQAQARKQAEAQKLEKEKELKKKLKQVQKQALARLQEAKVKEAKAKEAKEKKEQAEEARKQAEAEERTQEELLKDALIKFDKIKELYNIEQLSKVISSREKLLQLADDFNSKTNVDNKIKLYEVGQILEN